jgi:hypothetical protein
MLYTWLQALTGGAMIGAAAALLYLSHGRVAGISGIVGSLLPPVAPGRAWRLAFVAGLILAGWIAADLAPSAVGAPVRSLPAVIAAGLLVGFGTRLGSGCTSGHGVCGLARLSVRSVVAVATFMTTGGLTVWLARSWS